jgi:hypothetical protein
MCAPLEIILSADDFDADIAERYGWVNRALDDERITRQTVIPHVKRAVLYLRVSTLDLA